MLNENKVKMMTKMAIYEKNEGKSMIKNAKYFKGDYVTFGVLKTIIATSIAYIIMVMMMVFCNMEKIVADINTLDYVTLGKKLAVYYIIMVLVFAIISGVVYAFKYDKSRKGLKKYFSRLNKLERFYNAQRKKM